MEYEQDDAIEIEDRERAAAAKEMAVLVIADKAADVREVGATLDGKGSFDLSDLGVKTYCVSDGIGHIKIGKAIDPQRRIVQLQIGNPHGLTLIGSIDGDHETRLHSKYSYLRVRGEWFQADPELLAAFGPVKKDEIVYVEEDRPVVRQEEDGNTAFFCPVCPNSYATLLEAFWDNQQDLDRAYRQDKIMRKALRLVMRGHPCWHMFEVTISADDAYVYVRRIVTAEQLVKDRSK